LRPLKASGEAASEATIKGVLIFIG